MHQETYEQASAIMADGGNLTAMQERWILTFPTMPIGKAPSLMILQSRLN